MVQSIDCGKFTRNAVHVPEPRARQACSVSKDPRPWGRGLFIQSCGRSFLSHSEYELQMRRKAEVLQYKNVLTARMKKTDQFAIAVGGRNRIRSPIDPITRQVCPTPARVEAPSSASGVPGRQMLWLDKRVPYVPLNPRITYADEGTEYL